MREVVIKISIDSVEAEESVKRLEKAIKNIGNPNGSSSQKNSPLGGGYDSQMQKALADIRRYQESSRKMETEYTNFVNREAEKQYRAKVAQWQRGAEEFLKILNEQKKAEASSSQFQKDLFGTIFGATALSGLAVNAITGVVSQIKSLVSETIDAGIESVKTAAAYERTTNALTAITGSASSAKSELASLIELSRKTPGLGLETAEQGEVKLRAVGFEAKQAQEILTGISKIQILSGANQQDVQRALYNFTQIRAEGKLTGKELRESLQDLPALAPVIQKAFGSINSEKISELQLTSDEFFNRFITGLKNVQNVTGGTEDAWSKLTGEITIAERTFGSEFLESATHDIKDLTSFVRENQETWRDWGRETANVITGVIDVGKGLKDFAKYTSFGGAFAFLPETPEDKFAKYRPSLLHVAASPVTAALAGVGGADQFYKDYNNPNSSLNNPLGASAEGTISPNFGKAQQDEQVRLFKETVEKLKTLQNTDISNKAIYYKQLESAGGNVQSLELASSRERINIEQSYLNEQKALNEKYVQSFLPEDQIKVRAQKSLETAKQQAAIDKESADLAVQLTAQKNQLIEQENSRAKANDLGNLANNYQIQNALLSKNIRYTLEQQEQGFVQSSNLQGVYIKNQIAVQQEFYSSQINLYRNDAQKVAQIQAERNLTVNKLNTDFQVNEINAQKQIADYEKQIFDQRRQAAIQFKNLQVQALQSSLDVKTFDVERVKTGYDELIKLTQQTFSEVSRISLESYQLQLQDLSLTKEQRLNLTTQIYLDEQKLGEDNRRKIINIQQRQYEENIKLLQENISARQGLLNSSNQIQSSLLGTVFGGDNFSVFKAKSFSTAFTALPQMQDYLSLSKEINAATREKNGLDDKSVGFAEKLNDLSVQILSFESQRGRLLTDNPQLKYYEQVAKINKDLLSDTTKINAETIDTLNQKILKEQQLSKLRQTDSLINQTQNLLDTANQASASGDEIRGFVNQINQLKADRAVLITGFLDETNSQFQQSITGLKETLALVRDGDVGATAQFKNVAQKDILKEQISDYKQIIILKERLANSPLINAQEIEKAQLEDLIGLRNQDTEAIIQSNHALLDLSQKGAFSALQANAKFLDFLDQNTKSLTDIYADAKIGVVTTFWDSLDSGISKVTDKLGIFGNVIKQVLLDLVKLATSKLFSQTFGGANGSQNGASGNSSGGFSPGNILKSLGIGGGSNSGTGLNNSNVIQNLTNQTGSISRLPNGESAFNVFGGNGAAQALSVNGGKLGTINDISLRPASSVFNSPGAALASASGKTQNLSAIGSLISNIQATPGIGGGLFGAGIGGSVGGSSLTGSILGSAGGLIGGTLLTGLLTTGSVDLATTGGIFGSTAGLFGLSGAATFGIGAAIAGGVLLASYFIGRNSRRKQEEKQRTEFINTAIADLAQYDQLINDVKSLRLDGASAIVQGTALGKNIHDQYIAQANTLKDKKTRNIAIKDVSRIDGQITAKMAQLRAEADSANAAGEVDRRLTTSFAGGVYMDKAFRNQLGDFKRRNGLLPGQFTGKDYLPSFLADGELVLNDLQRLNVIRNAGGVDPFKNAGIPNYAAGTYVEPVIPKFSAPNYSDSNLVGNAVNKEKQPINVTIVINNEGIVESDIKDILVDNLSESDVRIKIVEAYDKEKPRVRNARY